MACLKPYCLNSSIVSVSEYLEYLESDIWRVVLEIQPSFQYILEEW